MPYMTENDPETRDPYENMMAIARAYHKCHRSTVQTGVCWLPRPDQNDSKIYNPFLYT